MLLAEILETDAEPVAYLIANNPAYTNPTGLGEPLQPRRDIHPIAEDVVFSFIGADSRFDLR